MHSLIIIFFIAVTFVLVEKYYPDRGGWFPVKEMLKGRSNFAAAVIENKIYVVGGYDGK